MDDSELQRLIDTFGETEGKKIHEINIAEKIAALEAKLADNEWPSPRQEGTFFARGKRNRELLNLCAVAKTETTLRA